MRSQNLSACAEPVWGWGAWSGVGGEQPEHEASSMQHPLRVVVPPAHASGPIRPPPPRDSSSGSSWPICAPRHQAPVTLCAIFDIQLPCNHAHALQFLPIIQFCGPLVLVQYHTFLVGHWPQFSIMFILALQRCSVTRQGATCCL